MSAILTKLKDIMSDEEIFPKQDKLVLLFVMCHKLVTLRKTMIASELPECLRIRMGRKIFEYLDFRDEFRPHFPKRMVYDGCLRDHGLLPDPKDSAYLKTCGDCRYYNALEDQCVSKDIYSEPYRNCASFNH